MRTQELNRIVGLGGVESEVIDLGMHPYADTFVPETSINTPEIIYPLSCVLDSKNGYIHNKYETNAFQRYNDVDYSYTSDNSLTATNHWKDFASYIFSLGLSRSSLVLEIGSNDGFLCSLLMKYYPRTFGIDASRFMAEKALERNVKTLSLTFNYETSEIVVDQLGKAKIIIGNNVLNHANNPVDFLNGIVNVLDDDGYFVFEVPYWLNQFKNLRFDMIYHEHVSYFTVKSICSLFDLVGLQIHDIEVVDYHGGSLRITSGKSSVKSNVRTLIQSYIEKETNAGLYSTSRYDDFMEQVSRQRSLLLKKINELKSSTKNFELFGIGASAKGNTFLKYYGLDHTTVTAITDASPLKVGKYTPSTRIPICDDSILASVNSPYVITLSWNIGRELRAKLMKINSKIEFLEL